MNACNNHNDSSALFTYVSDVNASTSRYKNFHSGGLNGIVSLCELVKEWKSRNPIYLVICFAFCFILSVILPLINYVMRELLSLKVNRAPNKSYEAMKLVNNNLLETKNRRQAKLLQSVVNHNEESFVLFTFRKQLHCTWTNKLLHNPSANRIASPRSAANSI